MSSATRRPGIELEAGAATKVLLGSYPTQRQIIYIYINIYTYIFADMFVYTTEDAEIEERIYDGIGQKMVKGKQQGRAEWRE